MKVYSSEELQNISSEFRSVARRLSRTDYSQCDANLKRFMSYVTSQPFILNFIEDNNIKEYDIPLILKERNWLDPFDISHVTTEEISLEYQLLTYALEYFDGDFTRLYGTIYYIRVKSTTSDEMSAFIEHIIDPLIDYISEHIRKAYDRVLQEETKSGDSFLPSVSATNSTIVFNSNVGGDISTNVTLESDAKGQGLEIVKEIVEILDTQAVDNSDEILELLELINESLKGNRAPKKGFLTALKSLCSGTSSIATLAAALIKLFFPS